MTHPQTEAMYEGVGGMIPERRMIKGKRKWWTLWLTRYPDYPAPEFRDVLKAAIEHRERAVRDMVYRISPLSSIINGINKL